MHDQSWMHSHPMNFGGHQMNVPLIPAPAAFVALILGLCLGMMIGKKKAMMHQGGMGMGMGHHMGGMGMGHMGGGSCGGGWGAWDMKKKMMMGGMSGHHHHGEGSPACGCGAEKMSGEGEEDFEE